MPSANAKSTDPSSARRRRTARPRILPHRPAVPTPRRQIRLLGRLVAWLLTWQAPRAGGAL